LALCLIAAQTYLLFKLIKICQLINLFLTINNFLASKSLGGYFSIHLEGISGMAKVKGEERRLSAVMFTDMVGYSALTQKNESLAVELLEEHRIILRSLFGKYHGREIETVGDAFFVEFTNALEAVHCAIAIQEKLYARRNDFPKERWISVRIGIHAGDVIHKEKQVLGDCVNIAARMEPLAEPGGICLSEDVARQIYNKIDLPIKGLGRSELKNIRLPIKIFKVVLPWEDIPLSFRTSKLLKQKYSKTLLISIIAIFICIIGYYSFQFNIDTQNRSIKRLAVLPLVNLSHDANNEYISNGFHEEIITVLSKIEELRVTGRTSVMKYKNKETDIIEVGEELNVDLVIEGSVRIEKNRIRLTIQLIDAKLDVHLWAQPYDRTYNHLFDLQRDLAFEVARGLKIELKAMEKKKIEKISTQNLKAHNLYMWGCYFWNSRIPQHLVTGLDYFQKAVDLDPEFAPAYAGIADSYHLLASYGLEKPINSFPKAKEAAIHALELDKDLARATNSLAAINLLYEWDWKEAEKGFIEALEIDPSYVQTYTWYALYLSSHKRFDEAKSKLNQAFELDPLSEMVQTDLAQVFYHEGNYDQAIKEYQKSLQLDSSYVYTYAYLGQVYAVHNMLDEAENAFKYAVELTQKKDPATMAGLAYVYARQNKSELAMTIVNHLENLGGGFYVHPMYLAIVYEALGDREEAIHWLQKGYEDRSEWMIFLQVEHMLDSMRGDARFEELVKKMKFE
jgi:TolB-like protein/class 3 adenylate cyclase/Flp pilus assembly protein TadD